MTRISKITTLGLFLIVFNGFLVKAFANTDSQSSSFNAPYSWDLDGDNHADALTDGLLLLRYTFGLRGNSLTSNAISPNSILPLEDIETRIINTMSIADIDGNSQIDPLTDGLLLLRYLFGLRENPLIDGVVATNATRTLPSDITNYLASGMPGQALTDYDQDQISDVLDPDDDNDGIPDINDPFPLNPLNGLDSDNDGLMDMFDDYPNDASNVIDTDGDGVADRFDIFPNNSSKTKAVVVNLKGAQSIGLGEALAKQDDTEQTLSSAFIKNNSSVKSLLDIFINKAHASTSTNISNLTNAIAWNDQGQVLSGSILSSETLFIAEAGLTPDGRFLYLLTSNHIQRALNDVDEEVCSIYKIHMQDYAIECLLATDLGDIEPGSLKGTMQTDYSRSGIDFRSDGAAVMTGFDWAQQLPTGVNGGTNSTIAWFLTADGELTSLLHNEGYFAVSALWLNDDYFAIAEYPFLGEDGPINEEHKGRIVIYNASDLSIHKRIVAENIWGPTVRANGDIFWQYGGALDGETLETYESPIDGIPFTDNKSSRLYGLTDYLGIENKLSSADETIQIPLSDGIATGYEWRKGSGTGTDISYRTFAFNDEYIAYIKAFGAEHAIVSVDGNDLSNQGLDISLSDNRGRLLINSNNSDQWFIAPSDEQAEDLVIDYQVQTDNGIDDRQLTISQLTIDNWRSDTNRPPVNSDARFEDAAIKWASPSPEREGICIYQFANNNSVCALPQGNVVKTDMETFRSIRYDNEAVYPNGTGNAYPGIRNVFFDNGRMRVFFKDSDNHQYYQAVAEINDFIENGEGAFSYESAVNGQGEQNIVTEAISLKPEPALVLDGITLNLTDSRTVTVNFPTPLSSVAPKPILTLSKNDQLLTLNSAISWNDLLTVATIELTEELQNLNAVVARTQSSIFIRDSIQQYMINNDDFIAGVAPINSLDTDGDGIIDELDNDDDNDGVEDTQDPFPNNPFEVADSDGDGVGDNSDLFPFDALESRDTDNDGYGDNQDVFPLDETEWSDTDGDGEGDNADPFPFDPTNEVDLNTIESREISMTISFGGSLIDLNDNGHLIYHFPYEAETWAGFANEIEEIYPLSFNEAGNISFIGSVPSNESVSVRFRFEKNPYPDVDPSYDTSSITITGSEELSYTIPVPSQGENQFRSIIMYVETQGIPVSLKDIVITANYENSIDENQESEQQDFDQSYCGSYCSQSNGLFYYHYALNSNPQAFPINIGGNAISLEFAGGRSGSSFIYTDNNNQQILVELDNIYDSNFLDSLKDNTQSLILGKNGDEPIDNSFRIYEGENQIGILNLVSNDGYQANDIKQLHPRLVINRVLAGTGSRNSSQCTEFSIDNIAEGISHHGQISLVPDELISGGAMDLLGIGGENAIYVCEDTPVGSYQILMQALDGQGGKKALPLQIDVISDSVEGGAMQWADCGNEFCQFMDGIYYYQYALNSEATTFPFHLYKDKYTIHSSGGLVGGEFLLYENSETTRIFSSYDEASGNYVSMDGEKLTSVIQAEQGTVTMSRNMDNGIDNSFAIYAHDQRIGMINLVENQGQSVTGIIQNYSTLIVDPLIDGTGSREDNKCREFTFGDFASGIDHHGQVSLLPDNLITGGSMSLLGLGGENSVYVCQDTPSGQYDIKLIAIDGVGGKRDFDLTIIVTENTVDGGAISWQ
jgi:hypothetical protein